MVTATAAAASLASWTRHRLLVVGPVVELTRSMALRPIRQPTPPLPDLSPEPGAGLAEQLEVTGCLKAEHEYYPGRIPSFRYEAELVKI